MRSMSYIFHTWYRALYQTLTSSMAQRNPFNPNPRVTNSNFNTGVLSLSTDPSHLCDTSEIQADYPLVKYWHKCNWTTSQKVKQEITNANCVAPKRGNARAAEGENVMMLFVENCNGEPIDGDRSAEIHKVLQSLFAHFSDAGIAPMTWSKASISTADRYRRDAQTLP